MLVFFFKNNYRQRSSFDNGTKTFLAMPVIIHFFAEDRSIFIKNQNTKQVSYFFAHNICLQFGANLETLARDVSPSWKAADEASVTETRNIAMELNLFVALPWFCQTSNKFLKKCSHWFAGFSLRRNCLFEACHDSRGSSWLHWGEPQRRGRLHFFPSSPAGQQFSKEAGPFSSWHL